MPSLLTVPARVYTTLGASVVLHALLLAGIRAPAWQAPRLAAFEPIEVSLVAAESASPIGSRRAPKRDIPASGPSTSSRSRGPRVTGGTIAAHEVPVAAPSPSVPLPQGEGGEADADGLRAVREAPQIDARADVAALDNPKPTYPLAARRRGIEGRVLVSAYVRADGACAEVQLKHSSGHALLDESALEAVRRWRFVPARRAGAPLDSWVDVPVSFRLDG